MGHSDLGVPAPCVQGMGLYGQHMMHMHPGMGISAQPYGYMPAGALGQPGQEPSVPLGPGPITPHMMPAYSGYHHSQLVRTPRQ